MEPFITLSGAAAPLAMANVDTDMIVPKQFLKTVTRDGLAAALFHDLRGKDFVLDRPAYAAAKILVAGPNFGCGSSREHAVWALADFGIRCVIAPSFADIFERNCVKNGLLPIVLPQGEVEALMDGGALTIDLEAQTIVRADGTMVRFEIDPLRKQCLLGGWDEIDLTLRRETEIAAFEARRRIQTPWL